ncbi:sulfotransferase family 2 domain-containing protein [Desulfonatronum thiodismutans]|uniref:sulfotransferase family 2 domain-containing protein n=1 Tax=Desulfonatronum thiodismutans TaxID=159290 RepID=UPI0009FE54B5
MDLLILLASLKGGALHNRHWWPQSKLLFFPLSSFSYIGKLENLEFHLSTIFKQNGINMHFQYSLSNPHPYELDIQKNNPDKITNANQKEVLYYSDRLRERVFQLYREDFVNFKYEK